MHLLNIQLLRTLLNLFIIVSLSSLSLSFSFSFSLAQDISSQDISGIYEFNHDLGLIKLHIEQIDNRLSAELIQVTETNMKHTINLVGTLEGNALVFDTKGLPINIDATIVDSTISMLMVGKLDPDETLEATFELISDELVYEVSTNTKQTPQTTLSHLLQFVPSIQAIYKTDLLYSNLWALSGFRSAATIQSQNDFLDLQFSEEHNAHSRNLAMLMHLPFAANNVRTLVEEMPDTVGFSWFDVQASLSYGSSGLAKLPESGYVAYTTIDKEPVTTALQQLGFAKENFQEQEIWTLGTDGVIDTEHKNPANPFGGELGTSANVLLAENIIGFTPYSTALKDQVRSYTSEIDSLATNKALSFLVEQLEAKDAILAQAYFPPVDDFLFSMEAMKHFRTHPKQENEAILREIRLLNSNLPKYEHLAIAHYFEGNIVDDSEYKYSSASIYMLYDTLEDAEQARAVLFDRLNLYYQDNPNVAVNPARLVASTSEEYFVVSLNVEDPDSALDERMSLAEPYNDWVARIFSFDFIPIFYFENL